MPKISELPTGTVTSTDKIAVAQGSTTIQATVADVITAGGSGSGQVVYIDSFYYGKINNGDITNNGTGWEVPSGVTKIVVLQGLPGSNIIGGTSTGAIVTKTTDASFPDNNAPPGLYWGLPAPRTWTGPYDNKLYCVASDAYYAGIHRPNFAMALLLLV